MAHASSLCTKCSHQAEVKPAGLIRRYGKGALSARSRGRYSAPVAIEAARYGWNPQAATKLKKAARLARATSLPADYYDLYFFFFTR
ncbi:hypothetical protein NKI96_21355 [Mesorhizobium sp. M0292]|uniref:hypothetical protein n=1 Tax=Mesorhizobium sp. M0292 TaxID=2956929 RepID=UPI00333DA665